jgi:cytochrome c oxidase subunit III
MARIITRPAGRSALSNGHSHSEHFPGPIHNPPVIAGEARKDHAPHASHPKLQHHFDDMAQQAEASTLGMWVFLVTEIMFFGGLFTAYLVYRHANPTAFQEASHHLAIGWGAFNTFVLILSSLTMALAVRAAQTGLAPKVQVGWLVSTMVLGTVFLGVKVIEYTEKFELHIVPGPHFDKSLWQYPSGVEIFYSLYFCMTGLHALHMIIGLGIMTVISVMAWRGKFDADYYTPVEVSGLYWHFVDIVWIFLFPLLYLIGRHYGGHV